MSTDFAPFSACSSPVVKSSSTPAGGVPLRRSRRTAPRIVTTAALLSAPRIALWRFVRRPLSLTTSTGPSSGTVSMWAQSRTVGAPSGPRMRASRLPESDPVAPALSSSSTSIPSPRRSSTMASATPRSRPDGLSISQNRMNSASRRSRSSVDTAWITARTLSLYRPALAYPARDAAIHDVDRVRGAEPLQETRGHGGALAGRTEGGDGALQVQLVRQLANVVIGAGNRPRDVPLVPLVAVVLPALVELAHGEALHPLDGLLLLAPRGHPAGEVAGYVREPHGGGQLGSVAGVVVVTSHEHKRLAGLGEPGQPRAEPAPQRGDAHRRRDVRLVELELGSHVHDERPVPLRLLHLPRRQRMSLDALRRERPAVERDDVLEVRRLRPERRGRPADEVVLVLHLEQRLVRALEADRRGDLQVHAGPAAHRPAE